MVALHAPLIADRPKGRWVYALPVISGVFLACVRETRLESALVVLSVASTYLLLAGSWRRRAVLVALLVVSGLTTSMLWSSYWDAKFREAYSIVERQGGKTYDGSWNRHHALWHFLWKGLGDFGGDKGYWNDDRMAYAYGVPRVNQRFGTSYRYQGGYHLENYYTPAHKHRIKPETLPEYLIVLREKVLGDILGDPLWYAGVIARRLDRILSETTPIRLGVGPHYVDVPFSAWLLLPLLAAVVCLRRWDQAKLLAFYLPTSLSALLVFAGRSMPYNSGFHMVVFAVLVCWITHAAASLKDRSRPSDRAIDAV